MLAVCMCVCLRLKMLKGRGEGRQGTSPITWEMTKGKGEGPALSAGTSPECEQTCIGTHVCVWGVCVCRDTVCSLERGHSDLCGASLGPSPEAQGPNVVWVWGLNILGKP